MQMAGVQSTGAALLAYELPILLIYIVVRPTDALTGETATRLLNVLTPRNINIKYAAHLCENLSTHCTV